MKTVHGEKQKILTMRDIQSISHFKRTYKTESKEEYEQELKQMNLTDLEEHAARAHVIPVGDRRRIEKNLVTAFVKAKVAFDMGNKGLVSGSTIPSTASQEKRDRALQIGKNYR